MLRLPGPHQSTEGRAEWCIYLIFFVIYFFSAKGYLEVTDTVPSVRTAESILTRGRLDIPYQPEATFRTADGRHYSKYGIGLPLYFLPWVVAARAASALSGLPVDEMTGFLISFANIPFAVLTLCLFHRCLKHFGFHGPNNWLLVAGLGLGTLCWRYACYDFSEAVQTSLLLLAYCGAVRRTNRGALTGGLGFAGLILVKLVHFALFPLFVGYLLLPSSDPVRHRVRRAVLFGSPVVLALAFVAVLNTTRFGNPLESGYGGEAGQFIPSQLWWTVPALLGSLDKGLFVFCPVLFMGLVGWRPFARRYGPEAALCAAVVVGNLLLAGAWHSWVGGMSWGPRLLVPAIPFWLLPAAFWLGNTTHGRRWVIAAALTAVSILNQIPGVLVKDQLIHHVKANLLTPEETAHADADAVAAWNVLGHKVASNSGEVYRVSEFGIPGDRQIDLTPHRTYHGFNLWTEQVSRHLRKPIVRWLPVAGMFLIGICIVIVYRRFRTAETGSGADPQPGKPGPDRIPPETGTGPVPVQ